jgi:hypothetical protein
MAQQLDTLRRPRRGGGSEPSVVVLRHRQVVVLVVLVLDLAGVVLRVELDLGLEHLVGVDLADLGRLVDGLRGLLSVPRGLRSLVVGGPLLELRGQRSDRLLLDAPAAPLPGWSAFAVIERRNFRVVRGSVSSVAASSVTVMVAIASSSVVGGGQPLGGVMR